MKQKTISLKNKSVQKDLKLDTLKFESDFFKCSSCGYTVRMLVLGDTATCSQCGGRMYRI